MKFIKIISMTLVAILIIACNESTNNPIEDTIDKIDLLVNKTWVFESSDNNKVPTSIKYYFDKNETFNVYSDSSWKTGTWKYFSETNQLLTNIKGILDTLEIKSVNANTLKFNTKIDEVQSNLTYVLETVSNNTLTISGSITFMPDVVDQDLSRAKVVLFWQSPLYENEAFVWSIGNINKENKTFEISVDKNIPMSLFMNSTPKINGYFNIGFVMLIWDNSITNGKVYKIKDLDNIQYGLIEDRSIIYINGDYKNWDIDFLIGDYNQGFNYCKGWYNNIPQQNDGWESTTATTNQYLKVLKAGDGDLFKMPNWS